MKKIIIAIVVIALVGVGIYYFAVKDSPVTVETPDNQSGAATTTSGGGDQGDIIVEDKTMTKIGSSAEGNDINAYHFGSGEKEILFVGGIHGGYEWNTALVAYELMDYLKANPGTVSTKVKVTVIPVLNPDGLKKVTGTTGLFTTSDVSSSETVQKSGRFNGNTVDLNRNFDCDWRASGTWQNTAVSGGTAAFSEPESQAIKQYVETKKPVAVIVWFSAAGGVYSSNCHNGVSVETSALTKAYAEASGYPAFADFDFYAITGDITNWLAKINVPAVSVLLTNHTNTEWTKNLAGVKAVLDYYAK